jgi:hypothetical protein
MEFNLSRIFGLVQRDWLRYRKQFLMGVVGLVILTFIITRVAQFYLLPDSQAGFSILLISFVISLFGIGGLLTSSNLGDLSTRERRIDYLSLPASHLEKIFTKWLYTLPLFVLILCSIFYLFFQGYMFTHNDYLDPAVMVEGSHLSKRVAYKFVQVFIVFHAIAFFFSFYFDRLAALKGGLVTLVLFLGLAIIIGLIYRSGELSVLDNTGVAIFNMLVFVQEKTNLLILLTPIMWVMTYVVFAKKSA